MKIFIGADHRGYRLKNKIVMYLTDKGHEVIDVGTHKKGISCDYPKFSREVGLKVSKSKNSKGILVCMTGIGHSIAANKVPGVRAALCYTKKSAYFSRSHNNANLLVLGAKFVSQRELFSIISIWLKTSFEGGRHARRVLQIKRIEKEFCKKIR